MVSAAAGVDASNTPRARFCCFRWIRMPRPGARGGAARAARRRVGVIVSDTLGRAWREGQTDSAIGAAGVQVIEDLRGQTDAEGRPLVVTMPCVADELASAADLVKGKAEGFRSPWSAAALTSSAPSTCPGARSIVRPPERDMFRARGRRGVREGFAAGAARSDAVR